MTLFLHSNFYTACCARAGRLDYQHRHHFFNLNWSKTKKTNAAAPPPPPLLFWIWVFKQNRKKGNPHHRHCSLLTVNICPSFTKPLQLLKSLYIVYRYTYPIHKTDNSNNSSFFIVSPALNHHHRSNRENGVCVHLYVCIL